MSAFPGPKWNYLQIAEGLVLSGFTGWSVRMMTAIAMAESGGYVRAHAINHEGSGTPKTSPAYLAEGYGLIGMDSYWIAQVWRPDRVKDANDPGYKLMIPFWTNAKTFSQLGLDPEWNLAMARQVFLMNALQRGWARAYEGWTSYVNGRHEPFLPGATATAKELGQI